MTEELRPNRAEKEFLTLAYNKFYDIYEEIISDSFWEKDNWYRFCRIKDAFAIYAEMLNYIPIIRVIEYIKKNANNEKILLKDILSEKDGVKFSVIFMKKILDTQVLK